MRKDELAIQASLYALNGITGNPVNQGKSISELVESAINFGVSLANRWEQITTLDAEVYQQFTVGALPATPTINYTANVQSKINVATQGTAQSTVPTTVTDPSGTPISALKTSL